MDLTILFNTPATFKENRAMLAIQPALNVLDVFLKNAAGNR